MENECSAPINKYITDNNMELQLTPLKMHRRNWAERSIQTGKAHLIAGLVGINPNFPLHLWFRLIPQCEKTLNMMRPTHMNPKYQSINIYRGSMNLIESHSPPLESLQSSMNPLTDVRHRHPTA